MSSPAPAVTVFDKIIDGSIPSWKVWEDESYLAFLTPFPNTPGVTVVIPKQNPGGYAFALSDEALAGLVVAAKKVANILERAFDVPKVGLVFEGEGVAYVHAKLYPLHGLDAERLKNIVHHQEFYPTYAGYMTTVEGPRMPDEELSALQQQIRAAAERTGGAK